MKDKVLMSLKTDSDFILFINSRFKEPIKNISFPYEYEKRRTPKSVVADTSNPEILNIIERELIRDNIFVKFKFDIFEFPFVVFHENKKLMEILKPFKKENEAIDYCNQLRNQDTYSLLISIMNHNIESHLFVPNLV